MPRLVKRVKGPTLDQSFDRPLVNALTVDTAAKIKQIREIAMCPSVEDGRNRSLAQSAQRAQSIHDVTLGIDRKLQIPLIDVWRVDLEPHTTGLFDQGHDFINVPHVRRHDRCHKGRRMMRLEPSRLVGNQGIGGRVRLVKSVTCEFFHQVKNGARQLRIDAPLSGALHEHDPLLLHLFGFLFTHGTAKQIRTAQAVLRQDLGNLHHLLLIQNHPVGVF